VQEKTTKSASISSGALEPSWENFRKYDGPAGLVVFLVAMPLCLGIALASGAPLFAGIIAGIVGGIVVGALSGSAISVSGPAAGLTIIVFTAIQQVGSFKGFLAAVVLSGFMQVLLGMGGAGVIGDYVPNSVIKGMLAAIGLVIILKQIPHALGRDKDFEGDFAFFAASGSNTFTDVITSIFSASTGAVVISVLSLIVLILWDLWSARGSRFALLIPGPLVVVVLGITVNNAFGTFAPAFKLTDVDHLVQLPMANALEFMLPDFGRFLDWKIWTIAATIALVASIESLLSIEAADRIDPFRRISSPNRELVAQGIGNVVSGMIGGLPLTSVVVRTSANVSSGGRTRLSAIFHGVLLLLSVLLIPQYLNWTPLASLAAVLIMVGYKLTKPKIYVSMFRLGWDQFLPFIATVVAIVLTDLLKGVIIGLFVGIFFVIRANHRAAISVVSQDGWYLLRFNKDMTFLNKSEFRTKLNAIPPGTTLIIDGTKAAYFDRDIFEVVEDFQRSAPYKNITIEIKRIDDRWR
jgi:MFS superfamily sulfate permease-like transporter